MMSFLLNPLLMLIGISIIAGILGSFIIWKRMACFTDTISHTALTAFTLSMLFNVSNVFVIFLMLATFSIFLLNTQKLYSTNTMLTMVNSAAFAVSMIAVSISPKISAEISSLLFGDILLTDAKDVIYIYILAIGIIIVTYFRWKKWLLIALNEDLAKVENINVLFIKIEFILILSMFISIIMQIIGTLLIAALIIVPTATARLFATRPLQMIVISILLCLATSVVGLITSIHLDISTSAVIVSISVVLFAISYIALSYSRRSLVIVD